MEYKYVGRSCYTLSDDNWRVILAKASKIKDEFWDKSDNSGSKTMSTYANGMEIIVRDQSNNGRPAFGVTCWSEEKDGLGRRIFLGSVSQVESMPELYSRLMV